MSGSLLGSAVDSVSKPPAGSLMIMMKITINDVDKC